ncbi:heparinase II/III family protein, partial [Bacillus sp. JJ1764]|uniref:heparinase II/III family protein n=1 Tax=Bacillus sp. JJ1764 TaxID=3122964 RepID=UPI003000C1AB
MIFKRSKSNKKSLEIANEITHDYLYVNKSFSPYKSDSVITWKENPFNDKTWCFYFHSLDMVGYLMNAYELDPRQEYLEKSKWFLESWISSNPSPENQVSPFAWEDHSTANRVINIIYFLEFYRESELYDDTFYQKVLGTLEVHGQFLYDDKNYNFSNNHGIFQDRSLLELSIMFPEFTDCHKWFDKAIKRIESRLERDVTVSGVHKEHSASYHIVVLKLFREINDFLLYHNKSVPILKDKVFKMEEYLAHIVKPDGKIPMTGDSGNDSISFLSVENITNPKLLYVRSNGNVGEIPTKDIVYKDAGVAIFRNDWEINTPIYLKFISSFHSQTHKHADDL